MKITRNNKVLANFLPVHLTARIETLYSPCHSACKPRPGVEEVGSLATWTLGEEDVSKDTDGRVPALEGMLQRPGESEGGSGEAVHVCVCTYVHVLNIFHKANNI